MPSRSFALPRRSAPAPFGRAWGRWRLAPIWAACFATVVAVALRGGLTPLTAAALVVSVGLLTWRAARVAHQHATFFIEDT